MNKYFYLWRDRNIHQSIKHEVPLPTSCLIIRSCCGLTLYAVLFSQFGCAVTKGCYCYVVDTPVGFSEPEVISMTRVLALFGASLQAVMVRNSKPDKELWATTHLVCATDRMNGKLEAAKRWKLPAVKVRYVNSDLLPVRRDHYGIS